KIQISSSKAATSQGELRFGYGDFSGVWSLVFGVFIRGVWCFVPSSGLIRLPRIVHQNDEFAAERSPFGRLQKLGRRSTQEFLELLGQFARQDNRPVGK